MKKETKIVTRGRASEQFSGMVNPPIYQTSTILYPTLESFHSADGGKRFYPDVFEGHTLDYGYGTGGTPTTFALQDALCALENGDNCVITSSGLTAITTTFLSVLRSGDHLLIPDNAYSPGRRFATNELTKYNIEATYYDPLIGAGIEALIQENTRLIMLEAPGSLTFEMQDVAAITGVAKSKNALTAFDNSWATPVFFNPLDHGVDICIQALTKYIAGHSDVVLGAIITRGKKGDGGVTDNILRTYRNLGSCASPYSCSLVLRGLRSLAARMEQHQRSVFKVVEWIKQRPEVQAVLFPGDPDNPGYELWKKQFSGASSLFSIVLDKKHDKAAVANMVDNLELFGIGASWGGFESLAINFDPRPIRTTTKWQYGDATCLRFFIGLENVEDLIDDLEKGFERLKG